MRRTLQLGKVDYYGRGRRINAVDIEVELKEQKGTTELSICGEIWNAPHTDIVSGGQNLDTIAKLFPRNPRVQRIVEVWRRWHLNAMRAGCEHQRREAWDQRPIDPSKPLDSYGKHYPGQEHATWNQLTWVRPEEYPGGLLTAPCPVCGYRYGSAWLTEELPPEIIQEVQSW
jgi:hypothetical protein